MPTLVQAMRAGLQGTMRIKGLLEMMFEVLSDWIDAFIEDIEEVEGSETGNTTPKGSISPRDSRGQIPVLCLQKHPITNSNISNTKGDYDL